MDNILSTKTIDNQQLRPFKPYGYVYITENLINGKKYLGVRSKSEFDTTYKGSGKVIKLAIKKYGWDNFKCDVYKWCYSKEELFNTEYELSIKWNVVDSPNWYNCMYGGSGGNTKESYTEEQMQAFSKKISDSKKNRDLTDSEKRNVEKMHQAWYGKHHTAISKDKISKANKNHIVTEETRRRMRENHANVSGENNPMYNDHRFSGKNNPMYGKSAVKGRIWINNGIDSEILINPENIISYPGYVKGRLKH